MRSVRTGFLYAVGDGNHSLAAAKQCWMDVRDSLTLAQFESHPARWALVELVNLHCPALRFESIHRALFGVDAREVLAALRKCDALREGGDDVTVLAGGREYGFSSQGHPIAPLQAFIDGYLAGHPGRGGGLHSRR